MVVLRHKRQKFLLLYLLDVYIVFVVARHRAGRGVGDNGGEVGAKMFFYVAN